MAQSLGGGLGWRVKGLWIWTGMHFLGRKLTSFEGSCIWPKALGGCPLRGFAYGPKPWGGGLEGQRSLDLDSMHFLGRKLTYFEGSCISRKALGGVGWRVKGLWIWTGKASRKTGCGREKTVRASKRFMEAGN